jgi:hypothetical protein
MNISTILSVAFFLVNLCHAQEKNIETESVSIENFISFIVRNYDTKKDDRTPINITFLLQVSEQGYSIEDEVILKQAFKLLSNRLNEDDTISLISYSGLNGIALKQCSVKELKQILYTLDNFKTCIEEFHKDGIELGYAYAKENFVDEAVNSVVMIRNPNSTNNSSFYKAQLTVEPKKKKNNAVILMAITLLPEIISVLKD